MLTKNNKKKERECLSESMKEEKCVARHNPDKLITPYFINPHSFNFLNLKSAMPKKKITKKTVAQPIPLNNRLTKGGYLSFFLPFFLKKRRSEI